MINHDVMIDADLCSRGTAQTQAFPAKCLDESFNVLTSCPKHIQCVNLLPQAYHTSHRAPFKLNRRDHAGAAMFMRSTPGCGTLAGPSLEWVAFWSPRPNGFAESPGLKLPGALGRPEMPGGSQLKGKSPAEDI